MVVKFFWIRSLRTERVMMLITIEILMHLMLSLALRVVRRHTLGFTGTAGMMFSQVRLISHLTKFSTICIQLVGFLIPNHFDIGILNRIQIVETNMSQINFDQQTWLTWARPTWWWRRYYQLSFLTIMRLIMIMNIRKIFSKNNDDDNNDDEFQVDECEHYAYVYTPLACPFAQQ